jgi:hypothetical protein
VAGRILSFLHLTLLVSVAALTVGGRSLDDPFDHAHAGLGAVLDRVLEEGLVDYAELRRSPEALDAYLASLVDVTPRELGSWSRS